MTTCRTYPSDAMKTKQCKSCKAEKPIDEFHRDANVKDGHAGKCKICKNAYVSEWYKQNHDRKTETDRLWSEKNAERKAESIRLWREQNPEKVANYRRQSYLRNYQAIHKYHLLWAEQHPEKKHCHRLLNEAVSAGKITRSAFCQACGQTGVMIHGHHDDYSKPLDVIWLCSKCHRKLHNLEREELQQQEPRAERAELSSDNSAH